MCLRVPTPYSTGSFAPELQQRFLHCSRHTGCLECTAVVEAKTTEKCFNTFLTQCVISLLIDFPSPKAYNEHRIINFLMGFCMVLSLQHLNSLKTLMNQSSQRPFEVKGYFYHYFTQGEWNI